MFFKFVIPLRIAKALGLPSVCLVLAACAAAPLVGETPSATPPQLVPLDVKGADGRPLLTWDRPLAFGRVPAELKATGDVLCMMSRIDLEAIGHHPRAKNEKGEELASGGFFCAMKVNGDRPSNPAPQLARVDGVLGWDRPGAFGQVPASEKARGDKVCAATSKSLAAIGYHPEAKSEKGTAITGGGFFCAPRPN